MTASGPFAIGIDAGATHTNGVLVAADGAQVARASAGGGNILALSEPLVESNLQRVLSDLTAHENVAAVCIGAAGAGRPEQADALRRVLSQLMPSGTAVRVVHDGCIALRAFSSARPAMIVIAGTGSLAYGERADGTSLRAGGYGALIGDAGSCFAIGAAAALATAQALDGVITSGELSAAVASSLGAADASELSGSLLANGDAIARIAALAPLVARADALGDIAARAIVDEQGARLSALAAQVARSLRDGGRGESGDPLPIGLWGGAFDAVPRLATIVANVLSADPTADVRRARGDAARAAALLALELVAEGAV